MNTTALLKTVVSFSITTFLVACGGSSNNNTDGSLIDGRPSGSSPSAPNDNLTFQAGTFVNSDTFKNQCESPRTGPDRFNNNQPFPDVQGSVAAENFYLRSWTNELYLWYDEVEDQDPNLFSTADYFESLKTNELTPAQRPKDNFHFSENTEQYLTRTTAGVTFGYGMSLRSTSNSPPREFTVIDVIPNSPAATAGIQRGMLITAIDGEDFINGGNLDVLNAGLSPRAVGESHVFSMQRFGETTSTNFTMSSANVVSTPVKDTRVVSTPTGDVGYIHFNAHTRPSEAALVNAFEQLEAEGVNDLVLDLRYNGGGLLAVAGEAGYMIAGAAATGGETFYQLVFNDKHTERDPVTGNPLTPTPFFSRSLGFSDALPANRQLPTLNLNRVYILSTERTCSASEAIINGLRGIDIEVVLIGGTTCGKPYGFYPQDNCGTTYFTVQFSGANAKSFGEYPDGFSPSNMPNPRGVTVNGCWVEDDLSRLLGDPEEGMFAAALSHRATGGQCPPIPQQNTKPSVASGLQKTRGGQDIFLTEYPELNNTIMLPPQ